MKDGDLFLVTVHINPHSIVATRTWVESSQLLDGRL